MAEFEESGKGEEQAGYARHLMAEVWPSRLLVIAWVEMSGILAMPLLFDWPTTAWRLWGVSPATAAEIALARAPMLLAAATMFSAWRGSKRGAVWAPWAALTAAVIYTASSDYAFYRLGFRASAIQALGYLITMVLGQSFLPFSRLQRGLFLAAASLAHVALELVFPSSSVAMERLVSSAGFVLTSTYSILISEVSAASELRAFRQLRHAARSLEQLQASRTEADVASRKLADAVAQLAQATQGLTRQSDRTGAETRGMASGIEQLAGSAKDLSTQARGSADALSEARVASQQIEEAVASSDMLARAILGAVADSGANIERLERSVHSIREFVDATDAIASQSNLLALNASLEAVRAGESGRGFRVVADEIRGLAQSSRERTVVVRKVVKTIVEELQGTVRTVAGVGERAERFQKDFERVRTALGALLEQLRRVDGMVDSATSQTHEQASTLAQLSQAAQGIAQLADANARVSGDLARTTAELDELAARLQTTVQG